MTSTRRNVVKGLAAAMAVVLGEGAGGTTRPARLSRRLGVQSYVLSQVPATGLGDALKTLGKAGFREIEGMPQGIGADAYRRALDDAGLVCPSLITGLDGPSSAEHPSLTNPDALVRLARIVGARNLVCGTFPFIEELKKQRPPIDFMRDYPRMKALMQEILHNRPVDQWVAFARSLSEAGAKLAPAGFRVGYHNHGGEFTTLPNGQRLIDLFLAETDPRHVDFELDLGWARSAGADPAALLRRHAGRFTQVHLKDLKASPANTNSDMVPADIGEGIQDWAAIADVIRDSRIQHAYVEQEPPYPVSGLASAIKGYRFLQPLFARRGL